MIANLTKDVALNMRLTISRGFGYQPAPRVAVRTKPARSASWCWTPRSRRSVASPTRWKPRASSNAPT